MTENIPSSQAKQADQGSRKRVRPWRVWLWGFGTPVGILGLVVILRDTPPFTWDEMGSRVDVTGTPDSPGIHLIGEVTKTRHYGIFHTPAHPFPFSTSNLATGATVIYDENRYFLVESPELWFLRSLIDKKNFPHIGCGPMERRPLKATSPNGAVDEARRYLKARAEPFD